MTDEAAVSRPATRLPVLDGWRAISILLVLGAHLLPLGPKILELNDVAGAMGMALFFTLSGFLIVRFLAEGMSLPIFAIRRLARILPLSWLAMLVLVLMRDPDFATGLANFLFYANLPPARLMEGGEHLWSICVEMQFYVVAALLCLLPGRKGLYLVPLFAILVTALRIWDGERVSIVTWHRVDEIFAGGTLALIYLGWLGERARRIVAAPSVLLLLPLLVAASHPAAGPLQYARPYAAAALVGASMFHVPHFIRRVLESRPLAYVADISYALYIIHGVLAYTWLGAGDTMVRYLKRPLLFGATFLLAHLSTYYFEKPISRLAHRLGKRGASDRRDRPPPERT